MHCFDTACIYRVGSHFPNWNLHSPPMSPHKHQKNAILLPKAASNCWHSLSIVTILSSQADIHQPIREGPSPIIYNTRINTPDILYTSYTTVNRSFARAHRIDSSEGGWNTPATCFSLFLLFSSVAVLWAAVIIWTLTKVCCMTMLANTADSRSQQSLQSGHVPPNYLTKLVTQRKSCVNLTTQLKQCLKYW